MNICTREACCSDEPGADPTPACYDPSACGCQVVHHLEHPNPSMTGSTPDTAWSAREAKIQERAATRRAAETNLRERLLSLRFDGPHELPGGGFDPFGTGWRHAVCLICGAMVRLDDPVVGSGGIAIERGISKHVAYHEWHKDYSSDLGGRP